MSKIIILNGLIASGKTTIGKALVEELKGNNINAVFLDLDDEVKKLNQNFKWENEQEQSKDWLSARKTLAEKTNNYLEEKHTVVVVGPFFKKDEINGYTDYINSNTSIFLFTLHSPLAERLNRNKLKENPNPDNVLLDQQKLANSFTDLIGLKINNSGSIAATVSEIMNLVASEKGRI